MASDPTLGKLMTPGEVSALFRVGPATVSRWAKTGKLESIRTPGGHRRFKEAQVLALLDGDPPPQPDPLDAAAGSLWPAGHPAAAVRNRLQSAGIATVRELTALGAYDLEDIGLRPPQVDEIRLVLHRKGLALHGEIADTEAA